MSELLSAILRKARRDRARDDIEYFAEYYLSHILQDKTPIFHKEMRRMLLSESRIGIAAPRGFAKSTNVQIIYGIYCLLFNEGDDILTISQSSSLAEDWIRKIKFELEGNDRIKNDFGILLQWGEKESKRWTATHLVIQKEGRVYSQIKARGRGCQVRGLRPTRVFCDDLEEEEAVRSEEQRKFLKEWFLGALLNTLKMDQQLIVIGTILHPLALLNSIIHKKDQFEKWETKKYVAIENGISLWENRFPVKDLLRRKQEIGTYAFEAEYQNNPIASDVCLWKPDWIETYEKLPEIKYKFVTLDPAASEKESADYSALCCMGVGYDDNIYEIETIRGHWGTWDLINNCINFYIKHKPLRFGIEEVAFQSFIRPVLVKEAASKGIRLPIEKVSLGRYTGKERDKKSPTDKYTRALSVVHFWEQGLVFLKTQDLIDEVSLFPTGANDDMVDAMVYAIRLIMKHTPISVVVERKQEIKGFEVKDNTIPCFTSIDDIFRNNGRDWKIG